MLILIRADLFVTQRCRHAEWPEWVAGTFEPACEAVLAKTHRAESSEARTAETDEQPAGGVSLGQRVGERGAGVGAAQHDCRRLRRPAGGHAHAFSVLCNQAACWLECSRTRRNTAADRCPWQRCPWGTRGCLYSPAAIRQETKAAAVAVRARLVLLYAWVREGERDCCWLLDVTAESWKILHEILERPGLKMSQAWGVWPVGSDSSAPATSCEIMVAWHSGQDIVELWMFPHPKNALS